MNKIKLCCDCKHFIFLGALCSHPQLTEINLVRGGMAQRATYIERSFHTNKCGNDGKLWEPSIMISKLDGPEGMK